MSKGNRSKHIIIENLLNNFDKMKTGNKQTFNAISKQTKMSYRTICNWMTILYKLSKKLSTVEIDLEKKVVTWK